MAKIKKPKELSALRANKLAMELQVVRIKCIEIALKHTFNGESKLWGMSVDNTYLMRQKELLNELDRKQRLLEGGKTANMIYLPSNGSLVDKIKDHFADDDRYAFTEVRQGQSGKTIVTHINSKTFIKKQIRMATKKKAAKKAAKTATKKTTVKKEGDSIRSFVDDCVKKKMDNAAIIAALDKAGYAYSINSVRWYASKARGGK